MTQTAGSSARGEPPIPSDGVLDALALPVPWLAAGVNGLGRARVWDAVRVVHLPALDGWRGDEVEIHVYGDGAAVAVEPPEAPPPGFLADVRALLAGAVETPYAAVVARRPDGRWAVGARSVPIEPIELGTLTGVHSISVARPPGGPEALLVDGEEPGFVAAPVLLAIHAVRQAGLARHPAFAATATRLGLERWELSVDPL